MQDKIINMAHFYASVVRIEILLEEILRASLSAAHSDDSVRLQKQMQAFKDISAEVTRRLEGLPNAV